MLKVLGLGLELELGLGLGTIYGAFMYSFSFLRNDIVVIHVLLGVGC